jgi:ankyrin repeat protein
MPELVKALLAHGANPNVRLVRSAARGIGGTEGATPFLLAAAVPDVNMMRILLAAGADPQMKTKVNDTPLMAAAGLLQDETFTQQEQAEALEAIKLTLELGGDVNAVNGIGRAALHGATNMYANGIIQFLGEHGANVDVRDKYQVTPLSIAAGIYLPWIPKGQELAEQGFFKKDTVDLLLKLGATPLTAPGYFTPVEDNSETYRLNPKREVPGLP